MLTLNARLAMFRLVRVVTAVLSLKWYRCKPLRKVAAPRRTIARKAAIPARRTKLVSMYRRTKAMTLQRSIISQVLLSTSVILSPVSTRLNLPVLTKLVRQLTI